MKNYGPETYGDSVADVYDTLYPDLPETHPMISRLTELAGAGPALELGIGTGRVALPLRRRGVEVHGIDVSEAMAARLRAKPGGDEIPVVIGDFARAAPIDGRYQLVFVVFNTFFGLVTQEEQVGCFAAVASRLGDDGVFVIEAFVPDLSRFDRGQRTYTNRVGLDEVMLHVSEHDAVNQQVTSQHIVLTQSGVRLYPVQVRYAWPSELDLMAKLAGLRLHHRWGGWEREPFTDKSETHVSVYGR